MRETALVAAGIWKQYRIGARQERYRTLRDTLASAATAPFRYVGRRLKGQASKNHSKQSIWALRDVSLQVRQGEVLGVIGRNGAGKSTLLKILSRITEPTKGYAEIHGRVGSLLEVGTGFHPELTGRENVFLNGAILGMTRGEITKKYDQILEFAEIEEFAETPVKFYSSGMYLRLAFAVAAHMEPEILLVDEVLAVGDAKFQRKCTGKMGEVARTGRTVLFVSHNMAAVRQLCTSAVLLNGGAVEMTGSTEKVVHAYLTSAYSGPSADLLLIGDRRGAGEIKFRSIRFENGDGEECPGLVSGHPGKIVFGVASDWDMSSIRISVTILDTYDQRIMHLDSKLLGHEIPLVPRDGELVLDIPRVHLAPGRYRMALWMQSKTVLQDHITDAGSVDVTDGNFFGAGKALADGFQVALMDFNWFAREGVSEASVSAASTRTEK